MLTFFQSYSSLIGNTIKLIIIIIIITIHKFFLCIIVDFPPFCTFWQHSILLAPCLSSINRTFYFQGLGEENMGSSQKSPLNLLVQRGWDFCIFFLNVFFDIRYPEWLGLLKIWKSLVQFVLAFTQSFQPFLTIFKRFILCLCFKGQ